MEKGDTQVTRTKIALQDGWQAKLNPDGRLYYLDHNSKTSHWLPPPTSWPETADLPYGWEGGIDEKSKPYYISHVTCTTTREDPFEIEDIPPVQRKVVLTRDSSLGFGFIAGSEKPVVVRSVTEGGPSTGKLLPGDKILKINGEDVTNKEGQFIIERIRQSHEVIRLTVIQPYIDKTGLKSSFLSAIKKQKLKAKPSHVTFAENESIASISPQNAKVPPSLVYLPDVLKVYLENGQTKSFKYDSKTTVKDVLHNLREKLGLKCMDYFSVVVQDIRSPTNQQLNIVQEDERVRQTAARPGSQHLKCLLRVTFVPKDAYILLSRDRTTFDYFYLQCCNDVVGGRFADELKYEIAMKLAALHIQQHVLCNRQNAKVSIKAIQKADGLERFLPRKIIQTYKSKDLRKAIGQYIKQNQSLTTPGKKYLTELQAKLHYLKILSELKSFGGKFYSCVLLSDSEDNKGTNMTILVGPKCSVSQVTDVKLCTLSTLVNFSELSRLKLSRKGPICNDVYKLEMHRKQNKPIILLLHTVDAQDMACLINGYYHLFEDPNHSLLPDDETKSFLLNTEAPPYRGKHHVIAAGWNYPDDLVSEIIATGNEYSPTPRTHLLKRHLQDGEYMVNLASGPPAYVYDAVFISKLKQEKRFHSRESIDDIDGSGSESEAESANQKTNNSFSDSNSDDDDNSVATASMMDLSSLTNLLDSMFSKIPEREQNVEVARRSFINDTGKQSAKKRNFSFIEAVKPKKLELLTSKKYNVSDLVASDQAVNHQDHGGVKLLHFSSFHDSIHHGETRGNYDSSDSDEDDFVDSTPSRKKAGGISKHELKARDSLYLIRTKINYSGRYSPNPDRLSSDDDHEGDATSQHSSVQRKQSDIIDLTSHPASVADIDIPIDCDLSCIHIALDDTDSDDFEHIERSKDLNTSREPAQETIKDTDNCKEHIPLSVINQPSSDTDSDKHIHGIQTAEMDALDISKNNNESMNHAHRPKCPEYESDSGNETISSETIDNQLDLCVSHSPADVFNILGADEAPVMTKCKFPDDGDDDTVGSSTPDNSTLTKLDNSELGNLALNVSAQSDCVCGTTQNSTKLSGTRHKPEFDSPIPNNYLLGDSKRSSIATENTEDLLQVETSNIDSIHEISVTNVAVECAAIKEYVIQDECTSNYFMSDKGIDTSVAEAATLEISKEKDAIQNKCTSRYSLTSDQDIGSSVLEDHVTESSKDHYTIQDQSTPDYLMSAQKIDTLVIEDCKQEITILDESVSNAFPADHIINNNALCVSKDVVSSKYDSVGAESYNLTRDTCTIVEVNIDSEPELSDESTGGTQDLSHTPSLCGSDTDSCASTLLGSISNLTAVESTEDKLTSGCIVNTLEYNEVINKGSIDDLITSLIVAPPPSVPDVDQELLGVIIPPPPVDDFDIGTIDDVVVANNCQDIEAQIQMEACCITDTIPKLADQVALYNARSTLDVGSQIDNTMQDNEEVDDIRLPESVVDVIDKDKNTSGAAESPLPKYINSVMSTAMRNGSASRTGGLHDQDVQHPASGSSSRPFRPSDGESMDSGFHQSDNLDLDSVSSCFSSLHEGQFVKENTVTAGVDANGIKSSIQTNSLPEHIIQSTSSHTVMSLSSIQGTFEDVSEKNQQTVTCQTVATLDSAQTNILQSSLSVEISKSDAGEISIVKNDGCTDDCPVLDEKDENNQSSDSVSTVIYDTENGCHKVEATRVLGVLTPCLNDTIPMTSTHSAAENTEDDQYSQSHLTKTKPVVPPRPIINKNILSRMKSLDSGLKSYKNNQNHEKRSPLPVAPPRKRYSAKKTQQSGTSNVSLQSGGSVFSGTTESDPALHSSLFHPRHPLMRANAIVTRQSSTEDLPSSTDGLAQTEKDNECSLIKGSNTNSVSAPHREIGRLYPVRKAPPPPIPKPKIKLTPKSLSKTWSARSGKSSSVDSPFFHRLLSPKRSKPWKRGPLPFTHKDSTPEPLTTTPASESKKSSKLPHKMFHTWTHKQSKKAKHSIGSGDLPHGKTDPPSLRVISGLKRPSVLDLAERMHQAGHSSTNFSADAKIKDRTVSLRSLPRQLPKASVVQSLMHTNHNACAHTPVRSHSAERPTLPSHPLQTLQDRPRPKSMPCSPMQSPDNELPKRPPPPRPKAPPRGNSFHGFSSVDTETSPMTPRTVSLEEHHQSPTIPVQLSNSLTSDNMDSSLNSEITSPPLPSSAPSPASSTCPAHSSTPPKTRRVDSKVQETYSPKHFQITMSEIKCKKYSGDGCIVDAVADVEIILSELKESVDDLIPSTPSIAQFRQWKKIIITEAKEFTSNTKLLVSSAGQSADQLVGCLNISMHTLARLCSATKQFIRAMPSISQAKSLANKVIELAATFSVTVQVAAKAHGKALGHPKMQLLLSQAQKIAVMLSALLRTLKGLHC